MTDKVDVSLTKDDIDIINDLKLREHLKTNEEALLWALRNLRKRSSFQILDELTRSGKRVLEGSIAGKAEKELPITVFDSNKGMGGGGKGGGGISGR